MDTHLIRQECLRLATALGTCSDMKPEAVLEYAHQLEEFMIRPSVAPPLPLKAA